MNMSKNDARVQILNNKIELVSITWKIKVRHMHVLNLLSLVDLLQGLKQMTRILIFLTSVLHLTFPILQVLSGLDLISF